MTISVSSQHALNRTVEQLWGAATNSGDVQVVLGNHVPRGWRAAHRMWVIPGASHPSMLVSQGARKGTSSAISSYSGLRRRRKRVLRAGLAAVAASGVPLSRHQVTVLVRDAVDARAAEPVHKMGETVTPIALIGVRDGANAKPTVQYFSQAGRPECYAKLAWSTLTRGFVERELEALTELNGSSGIARVPRVVRSGHIYSFPFVATEPLPADCVALRGLASLQVAEIAQLHPVVRRAPIGSSLHFISMCRRLSEERALGSPRTALAESCLALMRRITTMNVPQPIARRWHGDLVPWNAARDGTGGLWVWDWETSEPDAAVGLDIMHWVLNADGAMRGRALGSLLITGAEQATTYLQAAGLDPVQRGIVAATYAVTVADRGLALARANSGWHHNRLSPDDLHDLLSGAGSVLRAAESANR